MSKPEKTFAEYHGLSANRSRLHTALQHAWSDLRETGKESDGFGHKVEKALKMARESVGQASIGRFPGAKSPNRGPIVFQQFQRAVDQARTAPAREVFSHTLGEFKTPDLRAAAMHHLPSQFTGLRAALMNWHMPAVDKINRDDMGKAVPQVDRNAEAIKSLSSAMTAITAEMKGLGDQLKKGIHAILE